MTKNDEAYWNGIEQWIKQLCGNPTTSDVGLADALLHLGNNAPLDFSEEVIKLVAAARAHAPDLDAQIHLFVEYLRALL